MTKRRKNPPAVVLGGLGGLVRSEPNGGPTAKMVARAAWSKAARRELPRDAAAEAHGRDSRRKSERGGRLDSRPFRILRHWFRLWRNPLFRPRTALSAMRDGRTGTPRTAGSIVLSLSVR